MSARRILIVYGTSYGQTARVASRIRHQLSRHGFIVTLRKGDELPDGFSPADFDAVLVGASMIIGGYQKYIGAFVRRHVDALNALPSGFFAVSGSAGSANAVERTEAQRRMMAFYKGAGWHPTFTASIAGAIAYTKYNVFVRWMMKRISRKEGVSTDTSRDHEYTDWTQVERFAEQFAEHVEGLGTRRDARSTGGYTPATV